MMNVKAVLFLLFLGGSLSAQDNNEYWQEVSLADPAGNVSTAITAGSFLSSNFSGGSAFTNYISPSVHYRYSPRWSFGFGTTFSTTTLNNWTGFSMDPELRGNQQINQQEVFVSATYQASENLSLNGAIYHNVWTLDGSNGFGNNPGLSGNTFVMGADYKISENVQVGIQLSRSQGYQPFRNNVGFGTFNNSPASFGGFGWR